MYIQALKFVRKNFKCEPYTIHATESQEDPNARLVVYQVFKTTPENTSAPNYQYFFLSTQQLNTQAILDDVLGRDFSATLSNIFSMDALSPEQIERLFQQLVHDRKNPAEIFKDIVIDNKPDTLCSFSFSKDYPEMASHYKSPRQFFKLKEYENWKFSEETIPIDGAPFSIVEKDNKHLNEILKNDNLTPTLRLIIKLWILHQLKTILKESNDTHSAPHCLTHEGNVIDNIKSLEKLIFSKLKKLVALPPSSHSKSHSNRSRFSGTFRNATKEDTTLSPTTFRMLNRLPLFRPFLGHTRYDIHRNTKHKQFNLAWGKDKVASLLHVPLLKFLLNAIKNNSKKAYDAASKYIQGKATFIEMLQHDLQMLKAILTALWFPAISVFIVLSGLSSTPFYLTRKVFNISFGSSFDLILGRLECLKDLILLYLTSPIALTLYNTLASYAFSASTIPLMTGHVFIIATALTGYLTISIGAKLKRLLQQATDHLQPVTLEKLIVNTQNLNHNNEFRKLLGILHEKQAQQNLDNHDQATIETLREMILSDTEKDQLKQIIEDLNLTTRNVTQKRLFALARQNIKHDTFIPSDKLTNAIRKKLATTTKQEFNALDQKLAHIEENYDVLAKKNRPQLSK